MISDTNTPLRYPGGKSILTNYFIDFIKANLIKSPIYAEPYCGGAGAAINLLLEKKVERIILNDADISLYSFWHCIINQSSDFIKKIENTPITLNEWHKQKAIFTQAKKGEINDLFQIGFSTFFLNRCNRSGILSAGPIGGKSEQSQIDANYKIDARFRKEPLINKIKQISELSNQIEIHNLDALQFLSNVINQQAEKDILNTIVYLDPPYYNQGSSLYLNYYRPEDHNSLKEFISKDDIMFRWILSYDNVNAIKGLYNDFDIYSFYINYSAQQSKLGSELLIQSKNSAFPLSKTIKRLKNNKRIELIPIQ